MSVKVMSEVWAFSQSTSNARLVLLAIADNADEETRTAWPSIATIMRKTLLPESTVHRAIKKLCAIGELVSMVRKGTTNLFTVARWGGVTLEPPVPVVEPFRVPIGAPRGVSGGTGGVPVEAPRTVIEPSLEPSKALTTFAGSSKPLPAVRLGPDGFEVSQPLLDRWVKSYPGVNVTREVAAAFEWMVANPRRTKRQLQAFLVTWLGKCQEKAERPILNGRVNGDFPPTRKGPTDEDRAKATEIMRQARVARGEA